MWRKVTLGLALLAAAALTPAQPPVVQGPPIPPASAELRGGGVPPAPVPEAAQPDKLVQILRTPNKAQVNRFVCETLVFRNVNPFNIINFFWAVTSREEGGIYSFVNPDGKSGFLVVICPEYQLPALRQLAAELDRPLLTSAPGSKYIYYRMRHRNILDPGFLATAQFYLGTSGLLVPDLETNSVLILDAPAGAEGMETSLKEILDTPLQQLQIAVRVYEIDVSNDGTVGLDFEAWKNGPGRLLGQVSASGQYIHARGVRSHFNASSAGVFLDYPSAFFDFLVRKGKASTILNTKVAALNRVPAVLTADEKVIFYETLAGPTPERQLVGRIADQAVNGLVFPTQGRTLSLPEVRSPFQRVPLDPPFPLEQSPQDLRPITSVVRAADSGIFLTVVPVVGEAMVNMDLDLRMVTHTGFDGAGVPTFSSRQFSSALAVAPGDEIIFGGLVRERKVQTTRKVPILGSLPVLGYLFGGEITTNRKTVVVAAVTPVLVAGSDNVLPADCELIARAAGESVVELPHSEYCFEQSIPTIY